MASRNVEVRVGALVLCAIALFVYIGFQLGSFSVNTGRYKKCTFNFPDSGGLAKKAEVKIAGVSIGWVDSITLMLKPQAHAQVIVLVSREYELLEGTHATIKQDGLLGPKFLELIPGTDINASALGSDSVITTGNGVASLDELFVPLKNMCKSMETLTQVVTEAVTCAELQQEIRTMRQQVSGAVEQAACCVQKLSHLLEKHEPAIEGIFDSSRSAQQVVQTAQQIASQAQTQMNAVSGMLEQVSNSQGTVGKLLNESSIYDNTNRCISGVRTCVDWLANATYGLDAHIENMIRPVQPLCIKDAKGYFTFWIQPSDYYFFLAQIVTSEHGYVSRVFETTSYFVDCGCPVDTSTLELTDAQKLELVFDREKEKIKRNKVSFGLQFGFLYKWFAARVGIFEGTAGVALDANIPLCFMRSHLFSTFEIFDFRGIHSRLCCRPEKVPHLKWINRLYFFDNFYLAIGLDDIASSCNHSFFAGVGVQFIT